LRREQSAEAPAPAPRKSPHRAARSPPAPPPSPPSPPARAPSPSPPPPTTQQPPPQPPQPPSSPPPQPPPHEPPTPQPQVTDLRKHLSRKRTEHPTPTPSGATTRNRPDPRDKSLKRPITHTPHTPQLPPSAARSASPRSQSASPPPTVPLGAKHQRRKHDTPVVFSPAALAAESRSLTAREARLARYDAPDPDSSSPSRSRSRSPSTEPPQRLGRGDGGADDPPGPPQPLCPACLLPPQQCPGSMLASPPASCSVCASPFASGAVPYPEAADEPAETWTPPDHPVEASICDSEGHPLTWARVRAAHDWLTLHATCAAASSETDDAAGYDSDGDRCPCTWHPVAIEERSSHTRACNAWPGPICGSCWAASCECGYVFDAITDAHSRWHSGRLQCAGCAAP
jgi:hypothetical protein